jgi:hypothetical protein
MSSDSSSSDDDDVPLSALATNKSKSSESSKRPSRGSSRSSSRRSSVSTSYKEESDAEAEFDDDFEQETAPEPKSKKRKTSETKKGTLTKKKSKTVTKKKPTKKTVKKSESASSNSSSKSSAIISAPSELYAKSKKGKLIRELLCRWWYAMSWPDLEKNPIPVPPNCDAMDGFPGVFVVTSGDDVGKIIDKRDKDTCPCFSNMAKKPSEDLKELLLKAIEEQRKILIEKEGTGTQTEKDLRDLEKWTNKVNSSAADKEAKKVLKAVNIKID